MCRRGILLGLAILITSSTLSVNAAELGKDLDAEVFMAQDDTADVDVPVFNLDLTKKEVAYTIGCIEGLNSRRKAVIMKGLDLMCFTKYNLGSKAANSEIEKPQYLDCSGFVQWAILRATGYDIMHGTAAEYTDCTPVESEDLQIGDLGFYKPGGVENLGGKNHVGIFVGLNENGDRLWLHCTSGKQNGVNISVVKGFKYFARPTCYDLKVEEVS